MTSSVPMNGAVHEKVVSVKVSPISSVASVWLPPCFRVSESSLLTSAGGRPKSNTPNRLSANATKMPVMRRFTQGLAAKRLRLVAPTSSAIAIPSTVKVKTMPST